ncbi:hypothetical protein WJX81_007856 [Elliptochloris bilobata]|uniref:Uncharacterized protein n=1 Tax=Elliptochloris bilobata TaxID=381761 RepID=A0AAW1QNN1_9CHLO
MHRALPQPALQEDLFSHARPTRLRSARLHASSALHAPVCGEISSTANSYVKHCARLRVDRDYREESGVAAARVVRVTEAVLKKVCGVESAAGSGRGAQAAAG